LIPAYVEKGLLRDALAEAERWRHHDDTPWSYVMLAYVSGRSADYAKAKIALQQLEQLDAHRSLDPLSFSIAYIGLGDKEKALVFLEKAYEEHSSGLTALKG
jgi:tetratricopeptide (TPR) repeat protein